MPEKQTHLKRAFDNEDLARTMRPSDYMEVDWAIVMYFYAAVHLVEAYLYPRHSYSHGDREDSISSIGTLHCIEENYNRLKTLCNEARYQAAGFGSQELKQAERLYAEIKREMCRLLNINC